MPEETTDLVLKPKALHVVHVSIAVEQITLQRSTRLLQTATKQHSGSAHVYLLIN